MKEKRCRYDLILFLLRVLAQRDDARSWELKVIANDNDPLWGKTSLDWVGLDSKTKIFLLGSM